MIKTALLKGGSPSPKQNVAWGTFAWSIGYLSRRAGSAAVAAVLSGMLPRAQAETWVPDSGGAWNTPTSWSPQTVPNSIGATAIFNDSSMDRIVNYGANITVGSLTINNSTTKRNSFTNSGFHSLTFDEDGAGPNSASLSVTGSNAILGTVILNDNLNLKVERGSPTTAYDLHFFGRVFYEGAPSYIIGPGGITKNGDGIVALRDYPKAFRGPLVVNEGGVLFLYQALPSGTSSVTVASGAWIYLDRGGASEEAPAINSFGDGASTILTIAGNGSSAFPGALRIGNGGEGGAHMLIPNQIVVATPGATITINLGAESLRLSNVVSGPGALTLGVPALEHSFYQPRLILTADNAYGGGTIATFGTVVISPSVTPTADLGDGDVTIDGKSIGPKGLPARGRLTIQTGVLNAISDLATLSLTGSDLPGAGNDVGGFATLEQGVNEVIGGLVLDGVAQPNGTYGSNSSAATTKVDEFFAGPGMVTVVPEPGVSHALFGVFGASLCLRRFRRGTRSNRAPASVIGVAENRNQSDHRAS